NTVAFSPDGHRIVSGNPEDTILWDAVTGKKALTLGQHDGLLAGVAFSPDSHRIVRGSWENKFKVPDSYDNAIKVWDAATGMETLSIEGHSKFICSVAFSPDGRRIVSASADKTIKVWDAATGQATLTLKGHGGSVFSVAFSSDGHRIVSGSEDKTIKVW